MSGHLTGGGDGQTPIHPDDLVGLRLDWIQSQGELNDAEAINLAAGHRWAHGTNRSLAQLLDDRWLMTLHGRCFGEVWTWAGTQRTRATSIGLSPAEVPRATRDALLDAAAQLETAGTERDAATTLTSLHHRLTAIHPFANGNGRTLRLHADLLARTLQLPPPTWGYGRPDARASYLGALRAADRGAVDPLRAFIWS